VNTLAARRLPLFGLLALGCFVVHAGHHVLSGRAPHALWACHVAALSIAAGCFLGQSSLVAVGILWLSFGNPLWVLDLSTGGEFIPTSLFTHVGALIVGVVAIRRLGWPKHAWPLAVIAFVALMGLTRLLTSPQDNVNLAFRVSDGWEQTFPSYAPYFLLLAATAALTFFVAERLWRRALS
jgi:hypothetical protein